jgi:(4-O-methyl)-D-glucuronate---lignin esterase
VLNFPRAHRVAGLALAFALAVARLGPGESPPNSPPGPAPIPVPALGSPSTLPGVDGLPVQEELPPALGASGAATVRDVPFDPASWPARRTELQRLLEQYLTGRAPPAPGNVRGSVVESRELADGRVRYRRVQLSFGPGSALRLTIGIFTPAGAGPFPALIDPAGTPPGAAALPRLPFGPGQGQGVDALLRVGPDSPPQAPPKPAALDAERIAREHPALARGYAYVVFDHNDCGEDTTLRAPDGHWAFRDTRFLPAYPGYDWGLLRVWAWGVSRIVDYLASDAQIDARRVLVTGFSRTGKAALIAGAFDERIALTAPVASGGGGVGTFRHSGPGRGGKEGLDLMVKKYPNWFAPALRSFSGHTDRLPFDQHWLVALIAPRAFISLEGEADPVSLASAVRASLSGAAPVFSLLGASDKLGVHYAPRAHAVTPDDYGALFDFADAALGRSTAARRFDRFPPSAFEPSQEPGASPRRLQLWNGRDLSGWSLYLRESANEPKSAVTAQGITLSPAVKVSDGIASAVRIKDGVLRFESPRSGYLKTANTFSDYRLHVEWRWPKDAPADANSGVMLHVHGPEVIWPASFECQLKNGNAGQIVGLGLDIPAAPLLNSRKRAPRIAPASEATLGDWNSYEIYARGDQIEAFVNGVRQNAVSALPIHSGHIALQLEGVPIEFREVWLEPLPSRRTTRF